MSYAIDSENICIPEGQVRPRPTWFKVDFFGKERAHEKYCNLQQMINECASWHYRNGRVEQHHNIIDWSRGAHGFVRPHTPYFVNMPKDIYLLVLQALRAPSMQGVFEFTDAPIHWLQRYGQWSY